MNKEAIHRQIRAKQSYLCVGLDTDPRRVPSHLRGAADPVFEFNRRIVDATADYCVAYKPNLAFYEAQGARGWESLQKTLACIPESHFTIADAKRGDIGNTSALYARAFFDPASSGLNFDAVTVAPYLGRDSVMPFLDFPGKWVILLALTSNPGSADFQTLAVSAGPPQPHPEEGLRLPLFEQVIRTAQSWTGEADSSDRLMFVVGATQANQLGRIRQLAPDHFLLVPGVGAQGGSLEEVSRHGMNRQCGLLVNASRSILYASDGEDFARKAGQEAQSIQREMTKWLSTYG
ncbi:MAG: orotidine-5'-phosphate decarboxylase [Ferruginibacter sp.]|nr:orotidine-5'-phosphate decarboxylase [Cytophagales bacterium]